ncbi:MAG: family 10 glycosylhydrolase [Planctomycetota bacterium]
MRTCRRGRWQGGLALLGVVWGCVAPAVMGQSIIIDNSDPQFQILAGSWSIGTSAPGHWGADYRFRSTTGAGASYGAVEWRPDLPAGGGYQVAIYYPQGPNRADNAPFTVYFAGGSQFFYVNQKIQGGQWNVLGTFYFEAGAGGYVMLTNEANPDVVIADAVQFTPETTTLELTMAVAPLGTGTTTPAVGGPYTKYLNEIVPISATANMGYEFHHWEVSAGSPVADPSAPSTTVTMDQDKTVTAVFVEQGPAPAEFRAFWADAFHAGFKSTAEIDTMINWALTGNYNAIIPEILAYQDVSDTNSGHGAYWNSNIVPKAHDIVGGIDPLAELVQRAHAVGIEVHPWVVTLRVSLAWPPAGNALLSAHPEWIMVPRNSMDGGPAPVSGKYVLDPGSPDVQEYLISIMGEVLENYEVDGWHWDYIRYEATDAGYPAYNWYTKSGLARFKAITGYSGTPPATGYTPWDDFRRREITELVRRAQGVVETANNPRQPLRHTAALITWYPASTNFHATNPYALFSDWEYWQSMGYLDATVPMCYFDEQGAYRTTYYQWVDNSIMWANAYNRHTYIGPGIYMNSFANSVVQMEYARNAGADGFSTYSYTGTNDTGTTWSDWYAYVAANLFTEPAPTPSMPWRNPTTATQGTVYGRVTDGGTGVPIDNATIRLDGLTQVQSDGNGQYLLTKINAAAGGTMVTVSASATGYTEVARPAVLVERAGDTEINFGLGMWWDGDYDVDGDVDLTDYSKFAPCITGPDNGPLAAGCDLFDFDADTDIDLADFRVFQEAATP